jgi:hypothetical protein
MTPRACFLTILLLFPVEATIWPEFRGPNAQGVVKASNVPVKNGARKLGLEKGNSRRWMVFTGNE